MPRMATRSSNRRPGRNTGVATRGRDRVRRTRTMASSASLSLAPGGSGWSMPQFDGIQISHKVWRGDRVAATIGSALLRAGIASAESWAVAEGDPFRFVQLATQAFVDQHGGTSIRDTFPLNLTLTGSLNEYSSADREIDATHLYLTLDPGEAGYVVLGPTLRLLEEAHPRLPATFFHLLCGALNRWVRVYDYRDALEHVERLREWYSTDPDCDNVEMPDVEASIPASMQRKPLPASGLKRLLPALSGDIRRWMDRVIELDSFSRTADRPKLSEAAEEELCDNNPPLPCLLVVFSRRDNIEAGFDTEAESMMEVSPEPNLIISLNASDQAQVSAAFAALASARDTLAAASQLISTLPDSGFK